MRAVSGQFFAACSILRMQQGYGRRCSDCACHSPPCHQTRDPRRKCGRSYRDAREDFRPAGRGSKCCQNGPCVHPNRQTLGCENQCTLERWHQTVATWSRGSRDVIDRVRTKVSIDARSLCVRVSPQGSLGRCLIVAVQRFSLGCWGHRSWRGAACRRHVKSGREPSGQAAFHL